MSETIVTHVEGAAEAASDDVQRDLGAVEAHVEHHAETLEDHAEQLDDVQEDGQWLKDRMTAAETAIAGLPAVMEEKLEAVRSDIVHLSSTVSSLVSDGVHTAAESGESISEAPAAVENEAKKAEITGPFAGLRKLLHRLL